MNKQLQLQLQASYQKATSCYCCYKLQVQGASVRRQGLSADEMMKYEIENRIFFLNEAAIQIG